MKSILDIEKLWNRGISILGSPIAIFIFLSWTTHVPYVELNELTMSIAFSCGVLICSPNFYLGIIEALFGSFVLISIRKWFLIPIKIPFTSQTFCWLNEQTAFAGIFSFLLVLLLVHTVVKLSNSMQQNQKN